jgi:hypothetical protein
VEIQLRCPRCPCAFSAPGDTPAAQVLERMTDEAPWFALAEGETFADMVFAALASRGKILCPECRGEVLVGCDSPGRPAGPEQPPRRSSPSRPRTSGGPQAE